MTDGRDPPHRRMTPIDDDAVDVELTLEADPVWLDQIRAEAASRRRPIRS